MVGTDGGEPAIGKFSGKGPLRAWLRVVVTRELLRTSASQSRSQGVDAERLLHIIDDGRDPELGLLRNVYRRQLRDAFESAVKSLDDKDRALLRGHFLEGLNSTEVGAMYGVHRATASRWIADAREALMTAVRRALLERFGVGHEDVNSIVGLVQSQLDLSLSRMFRES
jgi:RNA polymerase sigma-70 factor (ECF subfamily)